MTLRTSIHSAGVCIGFGGPERYKKMVSCREDGEGEVAR